MLTRTTFSVALLLAALPALAQTAPPPPSAPPPKWGAWLDLEGKMGNKRNLGEADVFLPLWQDGTSLVFGNVKTRLDDYGSKEGNLGAGVRHMLESGWNIGTYGFFDRRRTDHANYFNQVTLGAEALSLDWDFRANVYLPQGRRSKNVDSLSTAEMQGTTVVFRGGEERSLTGFDGEIGYRVPIYAPDADRQLRIYGGGYRFYGEGVNPVQGPRARAEFVFDEVTELWQGARLSIGGEAQHDAPRGSQFFLGARLRIPLQVFAGSSGNSPMRLTPMERRMADPVVRDIDVVAQAGALGAPETVTATAGGQTITVLSSASTTGANLATAVQNAGANSTVILSGSYSVGANFVTVQAGQTLMGAGTLAVKTPSGRTALLTTPSASITGTNVAPGSNEGTVNMASNATVMGLVINDNNSAAGENSIGILIGSGVTNARIINSTITAASTVNGATVGISFNGATNAFISGNTIRADAQNSNAGAIDMGSGSGTIVNNTLSSTRIGGGINAYFAMNGGTVLSGSTGNTVGSSNTGNCNAVGANTGTVTFTNAANCGP